MRNSLTKCLKTLGLYAPARLAHHVLTSCLSRMRASLDWILTELGFPLHAPGYRQRLAFYSQFVRKGDLCFDIGANLGDRTEVFLALGATSVAVEPQDYCVRRLRKKFRKSQQVFVVPKAVGDREGTAEMMVSNFHALSSLSNEWVNSVKAGHRLGVYTWDGRVTVPLTTLKILIEEYGRPTFCKIDVEGFELQVLKTLSEPIDILSFEYNPEFTEAAIRCVHLLSGIRMDRFNYSVGESMSFALDRWITSREMCDTLASLPESMIYGDVYAASQEGYPRLVSESGLHVDSTAAALAADTRLLCWSRVGGAKVQPMSNAESNG